jgi:glycosyltransferase involved in cell wall biosynthesis
MRSQVTRIDMRPLRILVLAYYFPPLNSTASHRPYSWAAAWARRGHEVHVLTPEKHAFDGTLDLDYDLSSFDVHLAPYLPKELFPAVRDRSQARTAAQRWDRLKLVTRRVRLGLGMFGELAWFAYKPLLRQATEMLRKQRFDFTISTSPPEVVHFVGHALMRSTGVPWVADYRDLWFPEMRVNQFRFSAWFTGLLKRPKLLRAAAVSTVSEGLAQRLNAFLNRDVIVCYNGFLRDGNADRGLPPWKDGKRHIVYTGRLYPKKRDPSLFWAGLARALREEPQLAEMLCVHLYGYDDPWIRDAIAAKGLERHVQVHGLVAHRESLAAQRHADMLLFIDWMDERAEGILTGKLFEYLASGRPILCVGNRHDSEAARVIAQTSSGVTVLTEEEIAKQICRLAKSPSERVLQSNTVNIERYSRFHQADLLLDRIVDAIKPAAVMQ